jgi:hypothetical protein
MAGERRAASALRRISLSVPANFKRFGVEPWHALCIAQHREQHQAASAAEGIPMAQRRTALARVANTLNVPIVKYSLLAVAVTLWGFGLVDQLGSWDTTAKYLLLSVLICTVAMVG